MSMRLNLKATHTTIIEVMEKEENYVPIINMVYVLE